MNLEHQKAKTEAEEDYEKIFKPLIMTNGQFDAVKIKNEMLDLIFCTNQVSKVYMALTGDKLSKHMYYADVIIGLHECEIDEAYERGHKDGLEDRESGWQPIETAPKDGKSVLGYQKGYVVSETVFISYGDLNGWFYFKFPSGKIDIWHPTHWQPMPATPENL